MVEGQANTLSPHAKSRLTNGTVHFISGDGRTVVGRRLRDLIAEFSRPFGGFTALDEPLRQVVKRAALLSVEAETLEARVASGEQIDTLRHVTITNALNRCLAKLEAKRPTKAENTPTVADALALINGEGPTP